MPSRELTSRINWVLDQLVPPLLRDSRFFMYPLFWLLFGGKARHFMEFKQKAPHLDDAGIRGYYEVLKDKHLKRDTDLNRASLERILEDLAGTSVLDVGCGNGFLARRIAEGTAFRVVGCDYQLPLAAEPVPVGWVRASAEQLPFRSQSFDTVVCTHTLEHVVDLAAAVRELRRVARRRLIVVVPMQREYRFTFDLHLHFFPYPFSLQQVMRNPQATCTVLDNDLYYCEDVVGWS
jgi:ubiquinone/menaquinone biosynthesis C-methylase UbiE